MVADTDRSPVTFAGRTFQDPELELMRRIARDYAGLGLTEIARTVCKLLEWRRPSGGLKNHECRLLLEQLQTRGYLVLPPVRALGPRGACQVELTEASQTRPLLTGSAIVPGNCRLTGNFLWIPAAAVGNARRRGPISRHLLPGGQLGTCGPNHWAGPHGLRSSVRRIRQRHLAPPALPQAPDSPFQAGFRH